MKALLLAALLAAQTPAMAGRSCEQRLPDAASVQRSMDLAQRTAQRLDDSGARNVWRVVHELNSGSSARADLYRQGLGEFFLDERAQAWLQLRGYRPSVLRIDAITRLSARIGTSHIAFDHHPNSKRFADRIETVTVDSVFDWLQREGLSQAVQVQR